MTVFGDSEVAVDGTLNIIGISGTDGIVFPDGSMQTKAVNGSRKINI